MSETVKISAIMLTCNSERTIEDSIKSLGFVDEIVVVDSGSTDKTLEIVRNYTDKVFERPWPGFEGQYTFAQEQCVNDWVFALDSDEEVPKKLADEIVETVAANCALPEAARLHGYELQRRTFFLDRWIMHGGWAPDRISRVYDRRRGRWEGEPHCGLKVDGGVGQLKNYVYHYSYDCIDDQLKRLNRYSSDVQKTLAKRNKRFSILNLVGNPIACFIKEYFIKRGFMDGIPGLLIAVNDSFYVFNKYGKLWERQRCDAELVSQRKCDGRP